MNILFHCWEFPPTGSGIGAYFYQMSLAMQKSGHNVVVVTSKSEGLPAEEKLEHGTVCRAYEYSEIGNARVCDAVLAVARNHAIDAIEAADHLGEASSILRLKNRPPVIVKCHYNDVMKKPRYAQACFRWQKVMINLACLRKRGQIADEKYSIERCDGLIVPCVRMLAEIRSDRLKLPIHNAVIPNPFSPVGVSVGSESKVPVILIAGRIDIGKGVQYLPSLMAAVTAKYPEAKLEFAGDDTFARGLGSIRAWLTRQLGPLANTVVFLGKLNAKQMHEAFSRAWVVIVPSRWDTFPTVVLEAMARGKPVVASPHGGMPEMLAGTGAPVEEPGTAAFSNAVVNMIGDSSLRNRVGKAELEKLKRDYSPEAIVSQYIKFVRTCL